tara:strand:+ start:122 stop:859 length:738 start_codon:yes stop_codon:yes gene_type:complete
VRCPKDTASRLYYRNEYGAYMKPAAAPWSYSKIKAFEQCPKQFYHLKVAKDYKEPFSFAMNYGNKFHRAAEKYIRDDEELPKDFTFAKESLDILNRKEGEKHCEIRIGLTEDLQACGFGAKNVWWRGIIDLLILDIEQELAWVVDYKTGKSTRYADKGQLELMALAVFAHYPFVKEIRAGLLFVIAEELIKDTYELDNAENMWEKWFSGFTTLQSAYDNNVWNPKPSGLCRNHCVVLECPHNGGS